MHSSDIRIASTIIANNIISVDLMINRLPGAFEVLIDDIYIIYVYIMMWPVPSLPMSRGGIV